MQCEHCGRRAATLPRCACGVGMYCDVECQRAAWISGHKDVCNREQSLLHFEKLQTDPNFAKFFAPFIEHNAGVTPAQLGDWKMSTLLARLIAMLEGTRNEPVLFKSVSDLKLAQRRLQNMLLVGEFSEEPTLQQLLNWRLKGDTLIPPFRLGAQKPISGNGDWIDIDVRGEGDVEEEQEEQLEEQEEEASLTVSEWSQRASSELLDYLKLVPLVRIVTYKHSSRAEEIFVFVGIFVVTELLRLIGLDELVRSPAAAVQQPGEYLAAFLKSTFSLTLVTIMISFFVYLVFENVRHMWNAIRAIEHDYKMRALAQPSEKQHGTYIDDELKAIDPGRFRLNKFVAVFVARNIMALPRLVAKQLGKRRAVHYRPLHAKLLGGTVYGIAVNYWAQAAPQRDVPVLMFGSQVTEEQQQMSRNYFAGIIEKGEAFSAAVPPMRTLALDSRPFAPRQAYSMLTARSLISTIERAFSYRIRSTTDPDDRGLVFFAKDRNAQYLTASTTKLSSWAYTFSAQITNKQAWTLTVHVGEYLYLNGDYVPYSPDNDQHVQQALFDYVRSPPTKQPRRRTRSPSRPM